MKKKIITNKNYLIILFLIKFMYGNNNLNNGNNGFNVKYHFKKISFIFFSFDFLPLVSNVHLGSQGSTKYIYYNNIIKTYLL